MSALATPERPSRMLGRYRLLLELGHGGMARVYLALVRGMAGFSKLMVLKVMREELAEHPTSLEMFLGEARLAARMHDANVVQTYEVGEDEGRYFICMEYLEGQTLSRLLKRTARAPVSLAARLEVACQMLEGLTYLHGFSDLAGNQLGLVHRDISPNNVFVTFDGVVKLLDFGVAKATGISQATEAGTFKGKFGYAAPEQLAGRSDQRSDVFAAGILLWELLTYRRFTQDRTQAEIVETRMAGAEGELMLERGTGVPAELLAVCVKASAKDPDQRYACANEMRDAVRQYIADNGLEFPADKLRELLQELFQSERAEMRREIDLRMKQIGLEDEHPSQFSQVLLPNAPTVFRGTAIASSAPPSRPDNRGRMLGVGATIALLASLGGGLVAAPGRVEQAAMTPAALSKSVPVPVPVPLPALAPVPASAAAPAGTASTQLINVELSADPPSSRILLDDVKLDGNPFRGQLRRDGEVHRLELRAPGRHSEIRTIRLDRDFTLHLSLPRVGTARFVPTPSPTTSPAREAVSSNGAGDDFVQTPRPAKGARVLDTSNPYGR